MSIAELIDELRLIEDKHGSDLWVQNGIGTLMQSVKLVTGEDGEPIAVRLSELRELLDD